MVKNDQYWCWGMRPVMAVDEQFKQAVELDSSLTQRGSRISPVCVQQKNRSQHAMRIRTPARAFTLTRVRVNAVNSLIN